MSCCAIQHLVQHTAPCTAYSTLYSIQHLVQHTAPCIAYSTLCNISPHSICCVLCCIHCLGGSIQPFAIPPFACHCDAIAWLSEMNVLTSITKLQVMIESIIEVRIRAPHRLSLYIYSLYIIY